MRLAHSAVLALRRLPVNFVRRFLLRLRTSHFRYRCLLVLLVGRVLSPPLLVGVAGREVSLSLSLQTPWSLEALS